MADFFALIFDYLEQTFNLSQFQHFHFLRPAWLLVVIPFYLIYQNLARKDDVLAPWRKKMSPELLEHLTIKGSHHGWFSPSRLYTPLAVLITLILAGPTWQQQPSPFLKDKSSLVIGLDVSSTMNQNDIQPTRLLRAKQKINRILEERGDAKTALIAYAGSAHVAMPMTNDRTMIKHFLDVLDSSLIPLKGQRPETVLPLADDLLNRTGLPGTLLLLCDGTNQQAISRYKAFFNSQPHQLIIWAIGDTADNSQVVPLELDALRDMSRQTSGKLVRFSHDDDDIEQVNDWIQTNFAVVDDDTLPWYDAGYPLLFVIGAILMIWFRRGWSLTW